MPSDCPPHQESTATPSSRSGSARVAFGTRGVRGERGRGHRGGRDRATDRAQSMMDYTLGVSVFLLSVVVTFTLLSGVFTPFNAPVQSDQTAVANRLADQLLTNLSSQGTRNTLDTDRAATFFATNTSAEVRSWYRIRDTVQLNVTLLTVDPAQTRRLGAAHDRRAVATAVRIVIDDGTTCEPTCRLIVRVW